MCKLFNKGFTLIKLEAYHNANVNLTNSLRKENGCVM